MEYSEVYKKIDELRETAGFDISFRIEDAKELSLGLDLLPPKPVGLEIGSHLGASSFFMCSYRPDLVLYSLDKEPRLKWIVNMRGLKAIPLKGSSEDYPWHKQIDILFVDGDHSRKWCKNDLTRFISYVKDGGVIAGHDYDIETVKEVVDEMLYPKYVKLAAEHSFVYQKCLR